VYTFLLWVLVVGCTLSPWIFNPSTCLSLTLLQHSCTSFGWLELDVSVDSWQQWHNGNMEKTCSIPVRDRVGLWLTRSLPPRFVLLMGATAALEVEDLPPTSLVRRAEYEFLPLVYFGVPVYTALPSFLTAPISTGSRDRLLISPSFTSYPALILVLLQANTAGLTGRGGGRSPCRHICGRHTSCHPFLPHEPPLT
jgi:hypothetical protein